MTCCPMCSFQSLAESLIKPLAYTAAPVQPFIITSFSSSRLLSRIFFLQDSLKAYGSVTMDVLSGASSVIAVVSVAI